MTPADPTGGDPAGGGPEPPRRLSPPPPLYQASDEISLDDLSVDAPASETVVIRPTLRGAGPEPFADPVTVGVRVGRPFRMLWTWVAPTSSLLGLIVGAALFSFGMSVGQTAVAVLLGTMISTALLAVGVLDGRATGVPAEGNLRPTFGVIGSRVVLAIALVARVGWGALLLWIFASVVGGLLGAPDSVPVLLGVGLVIATAAAAIGYRFINWFHAVVTVIGTILVLAIVIGSTGRTDLPVAIGIGDGPPALVLAGTVIIVSITVLTVLPGAAAIGRYQASGAATMTAVWSTIGGVVPLFTVIVWGSILAASDPIEAATLLSAPVDGLIALVPDWARLPLAAGAGLGLLSALVLALYSGGFALQGIGVPIGRMPAVLIAGAATGAVSIAFTIVSFDVETILRDILPSLAVPVVAFAGTTAAGTLGMRLRRDGADRGAARWFVPVVFVGAIVAGYGLMTAAPGWLGWQGYLFVVSGVGLDGQFAASDPGVLVALVISGLAAFPPSGIRRRPPRGTHRVPAERTNRGR